MCVSFSFLKKTVPGPKYLVRAFTWERIVSRLAESSLTLHLTVSCVLSLEPAVTCRLPDPTPQTRHLLSPRSVPVLRVVVCWGLPSSRCRERERLMLCCFNFLPRLHVPKAFWFPGGSSSLTERLPVSGARRKLPGCSEISGSGRCLCPQSLCWTFCLHRGLSWRVSAGHSHLGLMSWSADRSPRRKDRP